MSPRKTFKLITTTPELISQINPKNQKLISGFLKEKAMRSSNSTVEGYESDLNIFGVWNLTYNENKFFIDLRKIEFSDFFSYCLDDLKWGSARFSRMKSCLSSLSNYIEKFYDIDYPNYRNIILKSIESMPKNERREKTILSDKQIDDLFFFLEKNNFVQELCWLSLAVSSGARMSELLRFETNHIDINCTAFEGLFLETTRTLKTKGRGRDGKMIKKYIVKDLFLPYYEKWLPIREQILKNNNKEHDFIFIKNNGDPAEDFTVRTWVTKIENFLGVPFYPHCARHRVVTYLAKLGLKSELIVELMGWTSESMFRIYNDQTAKDRTWSELDNLKKALEK